MSENARVINEGIDALQAAGEEHFINQAVQHFQANAAHSGTSLTSRFTYLELNPQNRWSQRGLGSFGTVEEAADGA